MVTPIGADATVQVSFWSAAVSAPLWNRHRSTNSKAAPRPPHSKTTRIFASPLLCQGHTLSWKFEDLPHRPPRGHPVTRVSPDPFRRRVSVMNRQYLLVA